MVQPRRHGPDGDSNTQPTGQGLLESVALNGFDYGMGDSLGSKRPGDGTLERHSSCLSELRSHWARVHERDANAQGLDFGGERFALGLTEARLLDSNQ